VNKVKGVYAFKVKGGPGGQEGLWVVDAKNGSGSVEFGGKGKHHGRRNFKDTNPKCRLYQCVIEVID
jgi:hypothetical protein